MATAVSPWVKFSPLCRICLLSSRPVVAHSFSNELFQPVPRREVSTVSTANYGGQGRSKVKATSQKAITITRAMRAYMEKVKEHDNMMKAEVSDYEIGKRHLANIMGQNPETFTQEDVDRAIEYLLPNGIFDKRARPMMKDPYDIFPKRKAAQFGLDGRPHHWLYFTTKPNYYNILYDINWAMEDLNRLEDRLTGKGAEASDAKQKEFATNELARSEWITLAQLQNKTVEKLADRDYSHFLVLCDRLAAHRMAYTRHDFIMGLRNPILLQSAAINIPQIQLDLEGRSFAKAEGMRKKCKAWVTVYKPGTGKVTINDEHDLSFFSNNLHRESIMVPLSVCDLLHEVDIHATVELEDTHKHVYNNFHAPLPEGYRKGPTAQAGAIRLGLARALTAFIDDGTREQLRLTGLLTEDPRWKERKKPGQEKARKKFTWKKR